MAALSPYVEHVVAQLERVAPVSVRRMFGGYGIYLDGAMFALIAYDALYFKVDDQNRPNFEAAGCGPFVYEGRGKPIQMSYYELPADVFEDLGALEAWMTEAHAAAVRAKREQKPRRR